jgi:hypothetical protein
MGRLLSLGAFAVAVVAFSHLWQGVRAALDGQRLYGPAEALAWLGGFVGSMGYLALAIYAVDRAAGRTRRRLRPFDWWLDRRGSRPPGGESHGR